MPSPKLAGRDQLMIRMIVGNIHISKTYLQVCRVLWSKMSTRHQNDKSHKAFRRAAYKLAIKEHKRNRNTYTLVMG